MSKNPRSVSPVAGITHTAQEISAKLYKIFFSLRKKEKIEEQEREYFLKAIEDTREILLANNAKMAQLQKEKDSLVLKRSKDARNQRRSKDPQDQLADNFHQEEIATSTSPKDSKDQTAPANLHQEEIATSPHDSEFFDSDKLSSALSLLEKLTYITPAAAQVEYEQREINEDRNQNEEEKERQREQDNIKRQLNEIFAEEELAKKMEEDVAKEASQEAQEAEEEVSLVKADEEKASASEVYSEHNSSRRSSSASAVSNNSNESSNFSSRRSSVDLGLQSSKSRDKALSEIDFEEELDEKASEKSGYFGNKVDKNESTKEVGYELRSHFNESSRRSSLSSAGDENIEWAVEKEDLKESEESADAQSAANKASPRRSPVAEMTALFERRISADFAELDSPSKIKSQRERSKSLSEIDQQHLVTEVKAAIENLRGYNSEPSPKNSNFADGLQTATAQVVDNLSRVDLFKPEASLEKELSPQVVTAVGFGTVVGRSPKDDDVKSSTPLKPIPTIPLTPVKNISAEKEATTLPDNLDFTLDDFVEVEKTKVTKSLLSLFSISQIQTNKRSNNIHEREGQKEIKLVPLGLEKIKNVAELVREKLQSNCDREPKFINEAQFAEAKKVAASVFVVHQPIFKNKKINSELNKYLHKIGENSREVDVVLTTTVRKFSYSKPEKINDEKQDHESQLKQIFKECLADSELSEALTKAGQKPITQEQACKITLLAIKFGGFSKFENDKSLQEELDKLNAKLGDIEQKIFPTAAQCKEFSATFQTACKKHKFYTADEAILSDPNRALAMTTLFEGSLIGRQYGAMRLREIPPHLLEELFVEAKGEVEQEAQSSVWLRFAKTLTPSKPKGNSQNQEGNKTHFAKYCKKFEIDQLNLVQPYCESVDQFKKFNQEKRSNPCSDSNKPLQENSEIEASDSNRPADSVNEMDNASDSNHAAGSDKNSQVSDDNKMQNVLPESPVSSSNAPSLHPLQVSRSSVDASRVPSSNGSKAV